jgi:hypothetical protein
MAAKVEKRLSYTQPGVKEKQSQACTDQPPCGRLHTGEPTAPRDQTEERRDSGRKVAVRAGWPCSNPVRIKAGAVARGPFAELCGFKKHKSANLRCPPPLGSWENGLGNEKMLQEKYYLYSMVVKVHSPPPSRPRGQET